MLGIKCRPISQQHCVSACSKLLYTMQTVADVLSLYILSPAVVAYRKEERNQGREDCVQGVSRIHISTSEACFVHKQQKSL